MLIATDLSANAAAALRRALYLPLAPGAEVEALCVVPEDLSEDEFERALQTTARWVAAQLERARAAGLSAPEVSVTVLSGQPAARILERARQRDAELVVLGRRGRGRLSQLLIGSTAERVARHADRPVLIVKRGARGAYRRPLLAIDASADPADSTAQVALALKIVSPDLRRLPVLHAYETPFSGFMRMEMTSEQVARYRDEHLQRAQDDLTRVLASLPQGRLRPVLRWGAPRHVILREIERRNSDLLVLGARGGAGILHFLLGSVAEMALRYATCDVLLVRQPEAPAEAP